MPVKNESNARYVIVFISWVFLTHACMHVLYLIKTGLVVKKFIVIILNRTTGVQRTNRVAILLVATRHFVVVGVVRLLLKNDL